MVLLAPCARCNSFDTLQESSHLCFCCVYMVDMPEQRLNQAKQLRRRGSPEIADLILARVKEVSPGVWESIDSPTIQPRDQVVEAVIEEKPE